MAENDTTPVTLAKGSKLQITKNGIKPCSQCYRARQFVKDSIGRLRRRPATHMSVTTEEGEFLIEQETRTLVGVPDGSYGYLLGTNVVLDAGWIMAPGTATRIARFSRYRKLTIPMHRA